MWQQRLPTKNTLCSTETAVSLFTNTLGQTNSHATKIHFDLECVRDAVIKMHFIRTQRLGVCKVLSRCLWLLNLSFRGICEKVGLG